MMEQLRRLRDAVTGRDREVEVSPDGVVREVASGAEPSAAESGEKADSRTGKHTKLAPRTFGE